MNLMAIDVATLQAGSELDALIAEEWMGWELSCSKHWGRASVIKAQKKPGTQYWLPQKGPSIAFENWSPSTNPAHAGEARRKAGASWTVHRLSPDNVPCCEVRALVRGCWYIGSVVYSEANGDKGKAEALATCRAIVSALKAVEAAEEK